MTTAVPVGDELQDGIACGADARLERLFAENSGRILAFCVRRLPTRAEAEDAAQLTFLYALKALRRGVVPEHESAWLHAIAKNVCRWQLRTAARRPLGDGDVLESLAGPDLDPDERELLGELVEALESIPERQRHALLLREWRGLTAHEIANQLELSTPATHALLTRARQSLQRALVASRQAALGVASAVHELRAWIKAAAGATSVKAGAVATVVAIGGAGGVGVSLERGSPSDGSTPPAVSPEDASFEPVAAVGREERPDVVRAGVAERGDRPGDARRGAAERGPTGSFARLPGRSETARTPWRPRPGPSPGAEPAPRPGDAPQADRPGVEPTGSDGTQASELPEADLPPVDPPEVDLPPVDLPPVEVPTVDLPGDALPPVEVPSVDLPPVDLPPVDPPAVDVAPLEVPPLELPPLPS